ncbi:MAG: peptidoglycan DD-metalloendopeptidase family protein [Prevotellaceae bacterium]|jgi:septal ring factor EnvC (AmiA/AmiB activator)|nr:peptidoglycan DD-metalloendopeptidase family protein [Prevotellaceae bacterium]
MFYCKYIVVFAVIFGLLNGLNGLNGLNAQDNRELEEQSLQMLNKNREREAEEMAAINQQLESNGKQLKTTYSNLALIQKKIDLQKSTLNRRDKIIRELRRQLNEKKHAAEQLQDDLERIKESYKNLLNKYYSIRIKENTWMIIMASESFAQAYRRMKYVREILQLLKAQSIKIEEMTARLNDEITDISKKEQLLSSNISEQQKEMAILQIDERKSQSVYSELKSKNTELEKQLKKREEAYNQLNVQMREHIRSEMKKNMESGISDAMLMYTKNFEDLKGLLPHPAIGVIVRPYGTSKSKSIYETVKAMPNNKGIDILTAEKAEVYAVAKGVVTMIGKLPTGGTSIIVSHGTFRTVYASLSSASVKVGDEVKARQKIGTVRKSYDGSVMHFEIWKDLEPQNPELWLFN